MEKLPLPIQTRFLKFYEHEISAKDLEQWLYAARELEQLLDQETYTDLISLNFRDKYLKNDLSKIIDPFLDFGQFEVIKLRKILTDLQARSPEFAQSLIATYDLYCSGYTFLDTLGLGYGLDFKYDFYDFASWEELPPTEKEKRIDEIYDEVSREASRVEEWLVTGSIVPSGTTDEMGHYSWVDKRTDR